MYTVNIPSVTLQRNIGPLPMELNTDELENSDISRTVRRTEPSDAMKSETPP